MQLRERQYESRLARSARSRRVNPRYSIVNTSARPPLQVMKTVIRWLPLVIAVAVVIYLIDTFIF
jgi:hypothetical protein